LQLERYHFLRDQIQLSEIRRRRREPASHQLPFLTWKNHRQRYASSKTGRHVRRAADINTIRQALRKYAVFAKEYYGGYLIILYRSLYRWHFQLSTVLQ